MLTIRSYSDRKIPDRFKETGYKSYPFKLRPLQEDKVSFTACKINQKISFKQQITSPEWTFDINKFRTQNMSMKKERSEGCTDGEKYNYNLYSNRVWLKESHHHSGYQYEEDQFRITFFNNKKTCELSSPGLIQHQPFEIYTGLKEALLKYGPSGKLKIKVSAWSCDYIKKLHEQGLQHVSPLNKADEILACVLKDDVDGSRKIYLQYNPEAGPYLTDLEFEIPLNKANALINKLSQEMEEFYTVRQNALEKQFSRGMFLPLKNNQTLILGEMGDIIPFENRSNGVAEVTLMSDGRLKIKKIAGQFDSIQFKRQLFKIDTEITIKKLDDVSIGKNQYLFTGDGLRQISSNAFEFSLIFPEGIHNASISQSNVTGDCYLLSALYGLMQKAKGIEAIAHLFSLETFNSKITLPSIPEEQFECSRYKYDDWDSSLCNTNSHGIKYIEEAYRQLREKYNIYGNNTDQVNGKFKWLHGGKSEDVLAHLTGGRRINLSAHRNLTFIESLEKKESFLDISKKDAELISDVKKQLKQIHDNPDLVACTYTTKDISHIQPSDKMNLNTKLNLFNNHAYTILSVDPDKEELCMFNPHNAYHRGVPKNEIINNQPGIFKISYEDYFKYFNEIAGVELPF